MLINNKYYKNTGIYYDTLVNTNSCDSLIITHLFVHGGDTNINLSICSNDSLYFNGKWLNNSGQYKDTVKTLFNCDSIIVMNLLVNAEYLFTVDTAVKYGSSYFAGGAWQTTTGTYYDSLLTTDGCDSIIITTLTVLPKKEIIVPNIFTPNGDGLNDKWKITNIEEYPQAIVRVYNRWGEKIFESAGYKTPWDGTYKGKQVYYSLKLGPLVKLNFLLILNQ
jgi:gliding motility-associated-like protein